MNAGKKRKLILPGHLAHLALLRKLGVPLSKAMVDIGIEKLISRPAADKLVRIYEDFPDTPSTAEHEAIAFSLFPNWLGVNNNTSPVQEPPANWFYEGVFPLGEWREHKE